MDEIKSWRCFHCDEVFTSQKLASDHFGMDCLTTLGCVKKLNGGEAALLDEIAQLRNTLASFYAEDGNIEKWARDKVATAELKVPAAEQRGYDKGVSDMRAQAREAYGIFKALHTREDYKLSPDHWYQINEWMRKHGEPT